MSRHGVLAEVLSDRDRPFLSSLMKEVEALLWFHKVSLTVLYKNVHMRSIT